jgi:hypothetical protein
MDLYRRGGRGCVRHRPFGSKATDLGRLADAHPGGSFLTDKDEPGDIDSVYVVESWRVLGAKVDARKAQFLQTVADKRVKDVFGLQVDCFILEWVPRPGTNLVHWAAEYRESRGYWDDLWSRERSTDQRENSVPQRGYVEVILDGYV